MIGKTLGRYEILGKLGEGGMASVYWARDPKLNRQVAVKILPPWCKNDPGHLGRFKREVRLLADLSHPNIVSIFDFGEAEEYVFYAMEFLSGGSLADEIARRGRLDYRSVLTLGLEMAGALDCIHRLGICHRDLKPHNILRSETGQFKLADFGLGKGEEFETITRAGELIGTLRYLPPEGLEGEPLDHTGDLFQLGLVLYEAACGARPYRGSNAVEILRSYSKDTPPSPSACCPDVPQPFDNFVWNLVQMRRKDRYTDVSAVLADLARLERGGNVRRRQPSIRPAVNPAATPAAKLSQGVKLPPPKPRQGLPPRVLAAMALVILMVLALIRPGRFRSGPSTPDVPADVAVRVGEHKAVVTWKTREPVRGVVEYGVKASETLMVAEEATPVTTHMVTVTDLEPGKEYILSLRVPEGVKPLQRPIAPQPLTVELVRAEAEGGHGLIEWKSSQPTRSVVRLRRYDTTLPPQPVVEDPSTSHVLRFEGFGPGVPFALSVEAYNDVDEVKVLDVISLVDSAMSALMPPPRDELLGAMNSQALKWINDPSKRMLVAARSILENHDWRRALVTRLPSMGFFLGNPQYPLEARTQVYRAIRLFQALEGQSSHLEASVATGLTAALPVSWMQTDTAAVRQGELVKLPLTGQETLVADPGHVPLSRTGPPVMMAKEMSVELPAPTPAWSAAELRLSGRLHQGTLIDADINGRAALVLLPPSADPSGESRIVQRIPVELLRAGANKITLTLRPMPGNPKTRSLTAVFTAGELALERGADSPTGVKVTSQRGSARR